LPVVLGLAGIAKNNITIVTCSRYSINIISNIVTCMLVGFNLDKANGFNTQQDEILVILRRRLFLLVCKSKDRKK
jgi:hypothetical protein